ncbi:nuclear envelope integral membrane protein 1 isoform X1 [Thamnophis elegans]|uniref:nuclear envelope integral membrane protein 1 isoform X1 n=1 Tax=Thamnophis elegans TaxID=35005 RepID=UPI001377DDC5|nr:nuclear envelope integral membrane protein 1 isoform X1 [Thamnophis elegans]
MAGEMKTASEWPHGCRLLLRVMVLSILARSSDGDVVSLKEHQTYVNTSPEQFCYSNKVIPKWHDIWTKIQIRINSTKVIRVIQVESEEKLKELDGFSLWMYVGLLFKEKLNDTYINVDIFSKKTCLKVETLDPDSKYAISVIRTLDPKLFIVTFLGLLLFFCGDLMSRSSIFFYSTGISIGILSSLLIVVYVLSRFVPKKSPIYLMILGGWSFSIYLTQLAFRNLQEICSFYWEYLLGYLVIVGCASFAVCYKYGPLENERSINLLTWGLQIFGLLLLYMSIQIRHIAVILIIIAICTKNLEYPVIWAYAIYRKLFTAPERPSPPRLLSEEEYRIQGEVETRRQLEQLREYCRSPEFSAWKAVSRIQSPKRFADFIEGASHVVPNEASVHEQEYGLGGSFLENQLFEEEDEEDDISFDDEDGPNTPWPQNHLNFQDKTGHS